MVSTYRKTHSLETNKRVAVHPTRHACTTLTSCAAEAPPQKLDGASKEEDAGQSDSRSGAKDWAEDSSTVAAGPQREPAAASPSASNAAASVASATAIAAWPGGVIGHGDGGERERDVGETI